MTTQALPRDPLHDRHLPLLGTRNLRDVGGYPAVGGRRTRWRTLFRSDSLDRLPPASQASLIQIGLRQVIDLRFASELHEAPNVFRDSARVRYVSVPLFGDDPPPEGLGIAGNYRRTIDTRGPQIAGIVHALIAPRGLPALIGCAAGIDRTGIVIATLLTAVGVPQDVVASDYALSATHYEGDGAWTGLDDWRGREATVDCLPEYMVEMLDHVEREHGGVGPFLARHGVSGEQLARLADVLTERVAAGEGLRD